MSRASQQEETARRRRAVFAVLGVLAVIGLAMFALGGGSGPDGETILFGERATSEGELPDGAPRHRRGHADAGVGDPYGDSGVHGPRHAISPEIADPQIPGPESDPGTSDDGPGQEFIDLYQGRSGRLSPHADIHGTQTSQPVRSRMMPPNVLTWTPSTIVSPGETVVIHAIVRGRHGEDITPDTFDVTIVNGTDPTTGSPMPLQPADMGYTYSYVPTAEVHPVAADGAPPIVSFLVRATGTYEGESYSRSATGTFNVHTPGARLDTARAQAEQRGSDIVVTVPVMIDRPGAYFGMAELWGGQDGNTPVAFGRDRQEYAVAGEQTFTFLFGGAVIRASGVDGPYVVRNVRFMQVDSIPPHQQTPTEELLTTPAWGASDFH
jgi:hypothetical protein